MSGKLPQIKSRQIIRALLRDGWVRQGQKGSHQQFEHPTKPGKVTVPVHQGHDVPPRLVRSILKQAGLTEDQLRELL